MENINTYTTPAGVSLLKDWGKEWEKFNKLATETAEEVRRRCYFIHGERGRNAGEAFGLAYTSSSDFAAIWNTNAEAQERASGFYFRGVAITDKGAPAIIWEQLNHKGEEVATVYEIREARR